MLHFQEFHFLRFNRTTHNHYQLTRVLGLKYFGGPYDSAWTLYMNKIEVGDAMSQLTWKKNTIGDVMLQLIPNKSVL